MAKEELEINAGVVTESTGELEAIQESKRRHWKKFWPRVITLILAVIIWAFVMEVNPPDVQKTFDDVPITIRDVSGAEVTVADGEKLSVNVTVTAKKNRINELAKEDISLIIDVYGITESGTYQLKILHALPSGFKVQNLSKDEITVNVNMQSENP